MALAHQELTRRLPTGSTYSIEAVRGGYEGGTAVFRITRTGNLWNSGAVLFTTRDDKDTSLNGNDVEDISLQVRFRPGSSTVLIEVECRLDQLLEPVEVVRARIAATRPQDRISVAQAEVPIFNSLPSRDITEIRYEDRDWQGEPFRKRADPSDNSNGRAVIVNARGSISFQGDPIQANGRPTYVYAHGWQDRASSRDSQAWRSTLKAKLGNTANVVVVDWSDLAAKTGDEVLGSGTWPRNEASVTRQVGECVADALLQAGVDVAKLTLVGHSLGSFVMAEATKALAEKSGIEPRQYVALDTAASGLDDDYDIDARNGYDRNTISDRPRLDVPAQATTSYTVSDIRGGVISAAGDTTRAQQTNRSYIVQYEHNEGAYLNYGDEPNIAVAYHNGTIGVYASLFAKDMLDPSIGLAINGYNASGKRESGGFDGVVVAPQPWATAPSEYRPHQAIGWATAHSNPSIQGSSGDDVMFFDHFDNTLDGKSTLIGGSGNDILIGDGRNLGDIDTMIGGPGRDLFAFGYKRYGIEEKAYDEKIFGDIFTWGIANYAVISDFNKTQDRLSFPWPKEDMAFWVPNADSELVKRHGIGLACSFKQAFDGRMGGGDVIAYVVLANAEADRELIMNQCSDYNKVYNLDDMLML